MSQAPATFPASLSDTHSPIPPKPIFQDFQFKIIGKEPALLMRLSNMATQLDDLDMDDIYEDLPLPSSSSIATQNVPCSRPTLFQTLAGGVALDANDPSAASLQSTSMGALDVPRLLPTTAPPLPVSPSGMHRLWTSSVSPGPPLKIIACPAGPSTGIQDSDHSVRGNRTISPPIDSVASPLDQDLRPVDSLKALKKVVVLKDKFRAVSATARQSQRLAKHALINAQRSAAAAQACLAAAESFVPCVGDVISAIRRMRSGAYGPASEWTTVLRDLEDDLYDLKQWSSLGTFGGDVVHLSHLRNPFGGTAQESCSGFPLTSVEEEAQEALRAWNQLDPQIHENGGDQVPPKSHILRVRKTGMEDDAERKDDAERIMESGTRVSKEIVDASTNLDKDRQLREQKDSQAGGRQSVRAEAAMQPRREVEESMPLEIATEAADAIDCQDRQDSPDNRLQAQQHPQSREESHYSSGSRGEGTVCLSMAASDIRNVASKGTPADCLRLGSASPRSDTPIGTIQATSKPQESVSVAPSLQDRDYHLQAAFATPITKGNAEWRTPAHTSKSLSSVQAEKQPMHPTSFSLALPNEVSAATDSTSVNQVHPSTPIPTPSGNPEAVASGGGELDKTSIRRSEITPGGQTSDRLRDESCTSRIKTEPVEPQLNSKVDGNGAVDAPVSNEVKNTPLKPDPETSVRLHSSPDECGIGTKSPGRISTVNLPAPLPNGLPPMKQKPPEAHIPPSSTGPVISDSVEVIATRISSSHNVANNDIPSQPVLSNSPASPLSQLAPTSQFAVHSPISPSTVPLTLRVEMPASYPNNTRDFDDSISPDLMFSRGWDDENDGSHRGSRRSPNKFEPLPRSQSHDVESRNQYVDHGSRSMASHTRGHLPSLGSRLSKSPDGRRRTSSYEYPAPLISKKRTREEVNHPSRRRDWTGPDFPSISENHISQMDMSANSRFGPLTTPIAEPSYNSNHSSRHLVPALINRLDPSSESTVQVASPLERRIQRPFRPQQPQTQNRPWQNSGYNVGHTSYGRRSNQSYDNDRPELLNRLTNSQQSQHHMFDSGHSPNVGRPSNRSHGRGRSFGGQGGAFQQQHQQHFSRKPLYDRLDTKP